MFCDSNCLNSVLCDDNVFCDSKCLNSILCDDNVLFVTQNV